MSDALGYRSVMSCVALLAFFVTAGVSSVLTCENHSLGFRTVLGPNVLDLCNLAPESSRVFEVITRWGGAVFDRF